MEKRPLENLIITVCKVTGCVAAVVIVALSVLVPEKALASLPLWRQLITAALWIEGLALAVIAGQWYRTGRAAKKTLLNEQEG